MTKKSNSSENHTDEEYNLVQTIELLQKELGVQNIIIEKLKTLTEVNSVISSSLDRGQVLQNILNQTKILMNCDNCSILLVDSVTNELKFEVLSDESEIDVLKDVRLKHGEGIAGYVWKTAEPLLIENVNQDERFCKKADEKTYTSTTSILATPLIIHNKVIGVMEAINKRNSVSFDTFDLELLNNLSTQAAIAIDNAKLYELATTDGLTGLFIHRYFQLRLTEEFDRAKRYDNELSLIMLDIDHFKNFNDKYGHQIGDQVLQDTSNTIKNLCRQSDIPCRYGGEELAVILPQTSMQHAMSIAERIRSAIEAQTISVDKQIISITISGGISSFRDNNPADKKELIKMADKALYISKKKGRNSISEFNSL
jgi:diguanylate cyclase (GGDEF)-like protein